MKEQIAQFVVGISGALYAASFLAVLFLSFRIRQTSPGSKDRQKLTNMLRQSLLWTTGMCATAMAAAFILHRAG